MSEKSEIEVIEHAEALLRETQALRGEAARYEKVHGMYLLPKLPKDLIRDEGVFVLSPDVIHEARESRAKIMTFDTEIQCIATERTNAGTVSKEVQAQVDALEAAGAMFLHGIDPDQVTKGRVIHRQLVEPLAVTILEMGAIDNPDPAKRFPWKWFDVDLEGCGWLEYNNSPTIAARQYHEYVSVTEGLYSGRKDGPRPGAHLRNKNGKWDFHSMSDDIGDLRGSGVDTSNSRYRQCKKVWLDDGEMIYHVALDDQSTWSRVMTTVTGRTSMPQGKLIWSGPNPFGRVSMFLTGSNVTPARLMQDHYLPFFLDLITTTEQRNVLESIRATASRNRAAPRDYWKVDPEMAKLLSAEAGGYSRIPPVEWADGKTPLGYGELLPRQVEIDPDMAVLDMHLAERQTRYSGASSLRDSDTLKNAPLGSVLAGYDAENAALSIVVGPKDSLYRQLLDAFEHSIKWLGENHAGYDKIGMQATGGEFMLKGGKKLEGGTKHEVDAKSFVVGHRWYVITSQRTRGQATAEFGAAIERMTPLPDGRPNIGVYDDLFRAAGVSDVNARRVTLAEEGFTADPGYEAYIDNLVKAATEAEIEAESGIRVGLIAPDMPPEITSSGGGEMGDGPNTGSHTNSPVTEPSVGGSSADIIAG